jgi:hypothetical protein
MDFKKVWESRRGTSTQMVVLHPRHLTIPRNDLLFNSAWPDKRGRPRDSLLAALAAAPQGCTTCMLGIWGQSAPERSGRFSAALPACSKLRLHPFQRAAVLPLICKMLDRAVAIPYIPILQSICPLPPQCQPGSGSDPVSEAPLSHACALRHVIAFVHAVLSKLLPAGLLGPSQKVFLRHVATFLSLRRFEVFSVHELLQGVATKGIEWLHALCAAYHACFW